MEKKIGKITEISVSFGGYQDAMLGLSVTLGSDKGSWGVGDFKGFWGPDIKHSASCKWSEQSRRDAHADTMLFIGELLFAAKKRKVEELRGVPVEVTFEHNMLKSWRVLTEAI
jgi:hypothetical protein